MIFTKKDCKVILFLLILLTFFSCDTTAQEGETDLSFGTKKWHVSPELNSLTSTFYPSVDWDVILQIKPGMDSEEVVKLVGSLQYYHHPINAIIFSEKTDEKITYEVALKLSENKKIIEDISYKRIDIIKQKQK